MEVVWEITLETDTPGPPDELAAAAELVRERLETVAIVALGHLLGDDGSCEATVRIDP